MKIFKSERSKAQAFFAMQQTFNLGALGLGNKGHRLLRWQRDLQRAAIGRQPKGQLRALRRIPPVTGE